MIIAVFPFEFYLFRDEVTANFVVDVGFVSLAKLIASLNPVHLSVFYKMSTGLVKTEWHVFFNSLIANVKNPVVVARSCIYARLSSDRDLLNSLIQI